MTRVVGLQRRRFEYATKSALGVSSLSRSQGRDDFASTDTRDRAQTIVKQCDSGYVETQSPILQNQRISPATSGVDRWRVEESQAVISDKSCYYYYQGQICFASQIARPLKATPLRASDEGNYG